MCPSLKDSSRLGNLETFWAPVNADLLTKLYVVSCVEIETLILRAPQRVDLAIALEVLRASRSPARLAILFDPLSYYYTLRYISSSLFFTLLYVILVTRALLSSVLTRVPLFFHLSFVSLYLRFYLPYGLLVQ